MSTNINSILPNEYYTFASTKAAASPTVPQRFQYGAADLTKSLLTLFNMTRFTFSISAIALTLSAIVPEAASQIAATPQICEPAEGIAPALAQAQATDTRADEALYKLPEPLRNIGLLKNQEPPYPCASLCTRNPMNGGAYLWAPNEAKLRYTALNNESGTWTVPGAPDYDGVKGTEIVVKYTSPGIYEFPTLTMADGRTYQAPGTVKIGGMAEVSHADTRSWTETYALGQMPFDSDGGWLGGTNNRQIKGVGNFYMHGVEDGTLEGVNVYLPTLPTRWEEGAKIRVRVWMSMITEDALLFTYLPLDGDYIAFEDIIADGGDDWVSVKGGAVMKFKLASPIDLYGKQYLFIDVDGFGEDVSKEDFRLLMDVMPNISMEIEDYSNLLSHNSFVRFGNETDYLRPVNIFGGGFGSFMICPVFRSGEYVGIDDIAVPEANFSVEREGSLLILGSTTPCTATLYSMDGRRMAQLRVDGRAEYDASGLPHGVYVLRSSTGKTVKLAL